MNALNIMPQCQLMALSDISDAIRQAFAFCSRLDPRLIQLAVVFMLLGACVGRWLAFWIGALAVDVPPDRAGKCPGCGRQRPFWERIPMLSSLFLRNRCGQCREIVRPWTFLVEFGTGVLFAGYAVAYLSFECQKVSEVVPTHFWFYGRLVYHLLLISLLIVATGTDFREYMIRDEITLLGTLIGVGGALISGDLQMIHLWVDWSHELPGLRGPYIPNWMALHQHLHGLAWSLAGISAGAGITWLVRWTSSTILGREAMGFGDVTLMGMIGSFMGWQPVVFVFALAPACGICMGLLVRLLSGKTYIPFGPYLSASAVLVLLTWRWLWLPTRVIFGHPPTLLMLAGGSLAVFAALLGMLRLYRWIPVK